MRAVLNAVLLSIISIAVLTRPFAYAKQAGQDAAPSNQTSVPTLSDIANMDFFSTRLDRLTDNLKLTPEQQEKIKPILEQETGELSVLRNNPSISDREKLQRLKKSVLNSDNKMKPILTAEQWQSLESVRAKQKEEVKAWEKKLPKKAQSQSQ